MRHLQYLVALAQEKHFAHAAERCDVSQPALSLALKQLESELGVSIVRRGNRFQGFTPEGELVLQWARRVLEDEATLKQQLQLQAGSLGGHLRVGVIPSAAPIASFVTSTFARHNPQVTISDLEMSSSQILRSLEAFEIDCGITYIDNEPLEHVLSVAVDTEEYVLVTPDDSALAGVPTVSWRDAAALPLCLLHRDMQNRRIIESVFESVGAHANVRVETNSMFATFSYLRTAYWSTIMPRSYVGWLPLPDHTHVADLVDPVVRKTIGVVAGDRTAMSPLLQAFWETAARLEGRSFRLIAS